jgi:uncharacterized peroxidase-related enzyme
MTTPEYEILAKLRRAKPTEPPDPPANIPVVSEADAAGELAEAYRDFREHFGRPDVPGILKCFSSSPELLRQVMEMSSTLLFSDGLLGRRHKEMIATYVSALNSCPYCADSHGFFLGVHGGDQATVTALIEGSLHPASLNPADKALLNFARKVNAESCKVDPQDVRDLRKVGWSDGQIAEAVHITSIFAFFNRVANAFGLASQGLLDSARMASHGHLREEVKTR